jgi:flagellar motility protein MotE (MotC chaperone)
VKKIALILLLIIGMTLSFTAIGLVILFATGAVQSIDEAKDLLSGQLPGGENAFLKPDEVREAQDGLLLLQQQKQELQEQIVSLKENQAVLEQSHADLSTKVKDLTTQAGQGDQDAAEKRAARLAQLTTLYSAMRPGDAAAIMNGMTDEMVLEILPTLPERNAARILNGLADEQRKADLSAKLLNGQMTAN